MGSKARGGPVLAAFQMTADVGSVVGPVVGGLLAERLSFEVAFTVTGAILLAVVLPWALLARTAPPGVVTEPVVTDDIRR